MPGSNYTPNMLVADPHSEVPSKIFSSALANPHIEVLGNNTVHGGTVVLENKNILNLAPTPVNIDQLKYHAKDYNAENLRSL